MSGENVSKPGVKNLTEKEQLALYGMIRFPTQKDKDLSRILQMKPSTLTSIKKRLHKGGNGEKDEKSGFYRPLYVPMLNRLGCEILGIIHTEFSPVIPLQERIKISRETIEKNQEIFLSIGALEQGFSLSFNKNYTSFSKINEDRTEMFGSNKLIEKKYPLEVNFPFALSTIPNFFDFSRLLAHRYNIDPQALVLSELEQNSLKPIPWFPKGPLVKMSQKEKGVMTALIQRPTATMEVIGQQVNLSRHTVARMKEKFLSQDLIRKVIIPDLEKLGFSLLVFYHFKLSPNKKIAPEVIDTLNSYSTIFFAARKYEVVIISAYLDYAEYKEDKMNKISYLKGERIINYTPTPHKFVLDHAVLETLKDLEFAPITEKILNLKED
jgi:DNA-binding Lrp family transcriptional regulator